MFKNILLSNIDIDESDRNYRRLATMNIGYFISISLLSIFAVVNLFFRGNIFAGIADLFFVGLLLYSLISLRKNKNINKSATELGYLLLFAILSVLFIFHFDNGVIFWALLFPFIIIDLLGNRVGIWFVIFFNLIVYIGSYYYWSSIESIKMIEYIRFIFVSIIISMLVYIYEKNFSKSLMIQQKLNDSLTKSMEEMKVLAITDSLTKIYNKRHFDTILNEEFNRAKRSNEPFILAIIDVDNFKLYNDTYGHDAGNDVLEQMGKVLKMQTLRSGDFAFRIGGEEFAIILQSSSKEDIHSHFENLREKVFAEKIKHAKNIPFGFLTISIGIVSITNYEKNTIIDVYQTADKNLYSVKNNGRNAILLSEI